jgi:hypothetical protein
MEKLYEHTLRKQMTQMQAKIEALEAQVQGKAEGATEGELAYDPSRWALRAVVQRRLAAGAQLAAPSAKPVQPGVVANASTGGTVNANTQIDASVGKTVNNVTINVFGQERLDRITKPQVFDILRGLGPVGENIKAAAEKAIIQAAMMVFSDPIHPEDITCFIPNKKGDDALIHGKSGWEVQPVGLVVSPMAAQGIETLFKHQPFPDAETPINDVKWIMEECGNIMRYIMKNEGNIINEPPKGEMRGILIRNKELLQQVLAKLPVAGMK